MHDHLSIEWLAKAVIHPDPKHPNPNALLEEICLVGLTWTVHREAPLLRVENKNLTWTRYIPFTSMSEFHIGDAPKSCDNEKEYGDLGQPSEYDEQVTDDEPEFIGNSALMEEGSGIYLDVDGKVDEGASS